MSIDNLFHTQGFGLLEEKFFQQVSASRSSKNKDFTVEWQLFNRISKSAQQNFVNSLSRSEIIELLISPTQVYNLAELDIDKDILFSTAEEILASGSFSIEIFSNIMYLCFRSKITSKESSQTLNELHTTLKEILKVKLCNFDFTRKIGSLLGNLFTLGEWLEFLKFEARCRGKSLLFACLGNTPYFVESVPKSFFNKIPYLPGAVNAVNLKGRNKREYSRFLEKRNKYNPTKIIERGLLQNKDISNNFVNVTRGIRKSPDVTCQSQKLYLMGASEVFGTGLYDNETLPNMLGKLLSSEQIEVINKGMGGVNWIDLLLSVIHQACGEKDHIILFIPSSGIEYADIKIDFSDKDLSLAFIDQHHLSPYGAELAAHQLAAGYFRTRGKCSIHISAEEKDHRSNILAREICEIYKDFLISIEANDSEKMNLCNYKNYLNDIRISQNYNPQVIGSVAVNCNPMTKGHLHLIEYAAKSVELLYVFVIEEDKSQFSFKDRLEIVKKGCSHLENVKVIKGGKFICTEYILPEYYYKDKFDSEDIDVSLEAYFFGEHIAPCLGIQKIFLGDEPICKVTRSYNSQMLRLMSSYSIKVEIIDRIKSANGDFISASKVRKLLKNNDYNQLEMYLPRPIIEDIKKAFHN